ncbi:MAG: DegT/DnrJ/EryC1/StrS family aminotransferase [candidate division WOR-3 bacterium]|nr:DegT/DnrJ/EryC1/StrS family aminotransferase [candidate division WOR-3 bacterium]
MLSSIADQLAAVLTSGQIAGGPSVAVFEGLLRDYLGNPWVTTNGDVSTALTLCLFQAGVRPGDDVIMSPLVCLATSCPVRNLFANIRWCDVDPLTGNLDPADIAKRTTPRTKAIVVYHWAGNPADLDAIHAVARAHNLAVIEDAGEALGAEYHGKKIGASGSDYTVFSFYPNRHLTTIDGGAITCARENDYEELHWLKRYGIHQPSFRDGDGEINPASDIPVAGWNSYMSHLAATIGVAQMEHLPSVVARYQENGLYYDERLAAVPGLTVLKRPPNSRSAYWVYTFLARERDQLLRRLRQQGVYASRVHLRNDHYTCFGTGSEELPGVDYFSAYCLSIPCGRWVTEEEREKIVSIIRRG